MFTNCDLKPFQLNDNQRVVGIVHVNEDVLQRKNLILPILRDMNPKLIIKVGKQDYQKLDIFISASLNDYYNRMNAAVDEEKNRMIANYNQLYNSWTSLNAAKNNHNDMLMEEQYNSLSYQLYLLGYKMDEK